MGPGIAAEPADGALKMALARRNNPRGCVHHSGHGAQYVSLPPSKTIRERGAGARPWARYPRRGTTPPWSRPWASWSRSACARACATREEAALDIFEYIEAVYSRARTHSALGHMSPAESEEANWPDGEGRPKAA